jgi:hypothetical protein
MYKDCRMFVKHTRKYHWIARIRRRQLAELAGCRGSYLANYTTHVAAVLQHVVPSVQ